jgi:phenylacetic acid degradation operon negative regulatory protein
MLAFEPQPQDLVITLLGAYLPRRDRRVWSGGLVRLLGELGFSTAAARVALARLAARDLLSRERDGRRIHYLITPRLAALLSEGDRRILSLGRAARRDGEWTVLWHVIPDERRLDRGRLARRLRFLGFGPVQERTWIAGHNREREVTELLHELDLTDHAGLLVGKPATSLDFSAFAARAWDLDTLAARYRAFVGEFEPRLAKLSPVGADKPAFVMRTRLVHGFREFPYLDPELPGETNEQLGELRNRAVLVFHRLYHALRIPAQRHFDAAVLP